MVRLARRYLPAVAVAATALILIGALLLQAAPGDRWAALLSWVSPMALMSGGGLLAIMLVALAAGYTAEGARREPPRCRPVNAAWHMALFPSIIGAGALVGATLEDETASDEC